MMWDVACHPNTTAANQSAYRFSGLWRSTAAITKISLTGNSGDIAEGSTFLLYGRS
jgi:hypothetical protein